MEKPIEARLSERSCTIYKPARIDLDGRSYLGLMTDISAGGAGLTCPVVPRPGSIVHLATGDDPLRRATVVWGSGDHFGVRFDEESTRLFSVPGHTYRSVRVPTDISAALYVNGVRRRARITNVSPRGVAFESDAQLVAGAIISLEAGGQALENVTIRWSREGQLGARLPVQVKLPVLQRLVHSGAPRAAELQLQAKAGR